VPRGHPGLDRCHHRLGHLHPGPPLVLGLDEHPWRGGVIGPVHHLIHGRLVLSPLLAVPPVFRGQLPGLQRVALSRLEPLELFGVRQVQPELDDDHALVGQRPFEVDDLPVGAPPLLLGGEPLDSFYQNAAVPGPVQHRHASPAGQDRPEPPQEVVAFFVVARRAELGDPDMPRVKRRDEPLDRATLPGGIPPLEDHADRRPELRVVPDLAAQDQPQLQQTALSRGQAVRLLLRGELQPEIQPGECAATLARHAPRLPHPFRVLSATNVSNRHN
jgi:hypothetical protein